MGSTMDGFEFLYTVLLNSWFNRDLDTLSSKYARIGLKAATKIICQKLSLLDLFGQTVIAFFFNGQTYIVFWN